AGHAILRSPDLWLVYNGGWTSNRSHHNLDLGTFVLVAGNERMVHDPGYREVETSKHSTVLVNGRGQCLDGQGQFLKFGSTSRFHYFASDLSDAYEEQSLQRFVRHMLMLHGSCLVIFDDLAADSPATFEWLLQTRHEVDLLDDRAVIRGVEWDLHVCNPLPEQQMHTHQWYRKKSGEKLTCLSIRPTQKTTEEIRFFTVLYPIRKADNAIPDTTLLNPEMLEIKKPHNSDDRITFNKTQSGWMLRSVNGESAENLGNVNQRTLHRIR
ncbi:MAG: heparinase II/III domain-containing protein, partial [Candidatus Sumerlaeota bacterium]